MPDMTEKVPTWTFRAPCGVADPSPGQVAHTSGHVEKSGDTVSKLYDTSDAFQPERAILVGIQLGMQTDEESEDSLAELAALADTAGAEVVASHSQQRATPDPTYYIGKGKVEEIAEDVEDREADLIIFDEGPLAGPGQERGEDHRCSRAGSKRHHPRYLRRTRADARSAAAGRACTARVPAAQADARVDPPGTPGGHRRRGRRWRQGPHRPARTR